MNKIVLDFDDASVINNGMYQLKQLKELYPKFKVSLFFIPVHIQAEKSLQSIQRDKFLQEIKDNLDWIELIPHGLTHMDREFENIKQEDVKFIFDGIEEAFNHDGLPFVKGFKAPYWLWNQVVVDELNRRGWWGATDKNQSQMLRPNRYYVYSHSIDEEIPDIPLLKLHGHIDGVSSNDLERCFFELTRFDPDTEFDFVSNYIEQ